MSRDRKLLWSGFLGGISIAHGVINGDITIAVVCFVLGLALWLWAGTRK
jgi:hypothetical protein